MSIFFRCVFLLSVGLLLTTPSFAASHQTMPAYVADQVIVGFQPGTHGQAIAEAHRQAGARALDSINQINAQVVSVPAGGVMDAIEKYQKNPNVRYAEPNYLRPVILPDEGIDPPPPIGLGLDYVTEQWYLNNVGQPIYYDQLTGALGAIKTTSGADIRMDAAWDQSTGDATIVVAVLDSGVECNHADLAGKCVEQINLGPSNDANDQLGHGTHVAGIAAAATDNGIGVAGVGWNTSIASIKVCYEAIDPLFGLVTGLCDSAASAAGMIHAADSGYHVVNMSYAGPQGSQAEADAAAYAWANGVVLVAAASNNYESTQMFPAAFPEVIAVAATDWHDNLASYSNFGPWVSVAAPGSTIFNTLPNAACGLPDGDPDGCYGWQSGTSMASPVVAGAAGLLWWHLPGATNTMVRDAIETNADAVGTLGQNFLAWTEHGRLNVANALANGGVTPPPPPPSDPGVHVGDLDGASVNQGRTWMAEVTVTVHDENHDTVSGATVDGTWSGGDPGSCATNASGQCLLQSPSMTKKAATSVSFTVTRVNGEEATPNHDNDGSSNGTSITVTR